MKPRRWPSLLGGCFALAVGEVAAATPQSLEPDLHSHAVPAGVETARNVDHVGFSVPDLDSAVAFFVDVLGAQVLMTGGPWADPKGGSMARVLGVHPATSVKVAMLRLGPVTSIELVEFSSPDQRKQMPRPSDWGAAHLAIYVADIDTAANRLRTRGIKVLEGPVTNGPGPIEGSRYLYFLSPWGMPLELQQRPGPLPYESAGVHPYGPAPAWQWRPRGETQGEVIRTHRLVVRRDRATEVRAQLATITQDMLQRAGTFEYEWLQSTTDPTVFVSHERYASSSAAASAAHAAPQLATFGELTSDDLGSLSLPSP